jgi:magnesium chelatase subunit I
VNQKSGVSARLSISNYEVAMSSARRRALKNREDNAIVRITDLGNLFASCSGKIELDPYRDESISEYQVVLKLLDSATKIIFEEYYPIKKYTSNFNEISKQIYKLGKIEISDQMPVIAYRDLLKEIPGIWDLLHEKSYDKDDTLFVSAFEFILEGLTVNQKLSRRRLGEISSFKTVDLY